MLITLFDDVHARGIRSAETGWPELCAYLSNPPEFPAKAACPLFSLATFGPQISAKGSLRHDANVTAIYGAIGDHDAGTLSPQNAAAMLQAAGVEAFIYTTPSHTAGAPRWRVVAPSSQPYAGAAYAELVGRVNALLAGSLASESFALSQSYYFGRVAGVAYECYKSNGTCIDLLPIAPLVPYAAGNTSGGFDLSDGPVPEWRGPTDDADLLRRALMSRSASGAFGARASFADLWNRNVEVLAQVYPTDKQGDDFNGSQADAALVSHLAFWTGRDGERILRLMHQSGLVRDKWAREDYLPRTIAEILARPGEVLIDKPIEAAAIPQASAEAPKQKAVTGNTFLGPEAQRDLFAGCVYIQDRHKVLVPGGALLKPEAFRVAYGGYVFAMDAVNERTTRNAWEAFTESQVLRAPMADTICFKPNLPPASIVDDAGRTRANVFWPAKIKRTKGDAGPFLRHLAKVLPNERDQKILLSYMAACVQYQGVKFPWAPVLQGVEGNGKTLFSACVAEAVGQHYTEWPHAEDLDSSFNGWIANKVFIALEELYSQEHHAEVMEKLKTLITGGMGIQIQFKGVDQSSVSICANFMITTNYRNAIRKTADNARRFATFFSAQQSKDDLLRDGMGGDYFPRLYDWLKKEDGFAIVADLLYTLEIPDEFNPAGRMHRAPDTSTTGEAIVESRGSVEQQIAEAIAQDTPGFMGGWVSSVMLDRLITDTLKLGNRLSHSKRRELMQGMGYILHPGLPDGRVNNPVAPDGRKPQLFILANHPARYLTAPADIARQYTHDQQTKV